MRALFIYLPLAAMVLVLELRYVRQIPAAEVRARAAARGPARSSQPGHIEFGTGN
eukprot:COSAG02_NODE_1405_length_12804_cov_41.871625_1_plen_55_part_00